MAHESRWIEDYLYGRASRRLVAWPLWTITYLLVLREESHSRSFFAHYGVSGMGTLALAFEIPGLNWTLHRFEGIDGNYNQDFVH